MHEIDYKTIDAAINSNSIQSMLCEPCEAFGRLYYEDDDWIILLTGQITSETKQGNILTIPKNTIISTVELE